VSHYVSGNGKNLVRASVAAVLGTVALMSYVPYSAAAEKTAASDKTATKESGKEAVLEEVQVTGSRIVRRDAVSNSPLLTVERQQLEDKAFISVEQALNELPQFMAGGVGNGAAAVTGLQAANGLDGGRGSGDMFNMALLPDNAGMIGIVVPGAANVNLRGLGANRSLVLVDGHRGMPSNASMTVDLNTIPQIAIGNIEVITGGASAVYGADALAGVTNIKFRDNFEGLSVRARYGVNEVGDGAETQLSSLMGAKIAGGRGNVMVGLEYSKREVSYWNKRDFFREVRESPYSSSGDYIFGWEPFYSANGSATAGSFNVLQKAWSGNAPTLAAINSVFNDRNCYVGTVQQNCVTNGSAVNAPVGGGFFINPDGTLYTRSSQIGQGPASVYYGPQGYNTQLGGTAANPNEVTCTFTPLGTSQYAPFVGKPCNPTSNRVDDGRWLSSPRTAYTLFGRGTFEINDHVSAYSNFNFAASDTQTRREPAPFSGGFGAIIPFHTTVGGDAVYMPSVIQVAGTGQTVGNTVADYRVGGSRGTNCAPVGGCTMAQAFPITTELRTLLESRPGSLIGTTGANATNPFRGLSACNVYTLATNNPGGAGVLTNPTSGAQYVVQIDPNTGLPLSTCGANSGWQVNTQLAWMPPRGTVNTSRLYQFAAGLKGDFGFSDWTWDAYTSYGDSETQTQYRGFSSLLNYQKIISAPNYGQGYREEGLNSKTLHCTSGINPFKSNLVVSQDCIDAIQSQQIDRNTMLQRIHELTAQGHLFDLPAGDVRASVGASYRKNSYTFTPDSQRAREYVGDSSAGQFGVGKINESVTAKEVYGELLVPLLKDLPFIRTLELELGARDSKYSTGQNVKTYKALASWQPLEWLRARGGYNRAERAPNLSELYATPSGSSQFLSAPIDPCRNNTGNAIFFPGPTTGSTLNNSATTDPAVRAKLQALCATQISYWGGGSTASDFHSDPVNWDVGGGAALIVGNPDLKNEKGDTWTMGLTFNLPFEHVLLNHISGTLDWYEAKVANPIEVQTTAQVVNGCFNINGLNPTFSLDDPSGYCRLIERDTSTGAILRVYNTFGNQNKLVIRGVDFAMRWSAPLSDMGLDRVPGSLSVNLSGTYLIDQIQFFGGGKTDDFAGYGGASRVRTDTTFNYTWGAGNRVSLMWQYREGTQTASTFAVTGAADGSTGPKLHRNPLMAGYHTSNMFNGTVGTRFGKLNASLSVNNLLNTKPTPGGYDLRDPMNGFGNFSPFDDLVGRRYQVSLSMDF
jgi:iron complex outermembrane receptor protein